MAGHDVERLSRGLLKRKAGIGKHPGDAPKHAMTAAIVLGIAAAAFLGAGLVLTQFGLRTIHPLSGAAISVPSFTIVFILHLADPAARRDHRLARGADFRRRGPRIPRRADDSHLRVQPRARTGGHRRARQSVATALGRSRGPAAARAASRPAIRRPRGRRAGRTGNHRHAHRRHARLAHLGAAAAARRVGDARRDSAGDQGRAGNLAEPDRRGPDRLHRLDADGARVGARPHRPLPRAGAAGRQVVVRAQWHLQRHRHAAALPRTRRRAGLGGRAAVRDLSAVHGRA